MMREQTARDLESRPRTAIPSTGGSGDGSAPENGDAAFDAIENIEAIPGLGPIRVRALKKAGFSTLALLRAATTADLRAVPGMTEIKAAQLAAYLRGEADRVGGEAPAPKTRKGARTEARTSKPARRTSPPRAAMSRTAPPLAPTTAPAPAPAFAESSLVTAARRVAASAGEVLRSEAAAGFDRGLARQLGKIAALAERIARDAIEPRDEERAAVQLSKVEQLVGEIAAEGSPGQKRQDRFADALRDRRHKLQQALGATEGSAGRDDAPPASEKDRTGKSDKKSRHDR